MNNFAITSEDLATSLENSSAALVAAGNSFAEAQALEVAGNMYCLEIGKPIFRMYLIAGKSLELYNHNIKEIII